MYKQRRKQVMSGRKDVVLKNITLNKFVFGGQAIASAPDGRTIFTWGGLPGENVDIAVNRSKSTYIEGTVLKVNKKSRSRIEPKEPDSYLSSSPWQILGCRFEEQAKQEILEETFIRAGIVGVEYENFEGDGEYYHYRNKQEYPFWGDDKGLHLAHYQRGSHNKIITSGSTLAKTEINQAATDVLKELNRLNTRAGDLKTLLLRCNQSGKVTASLFVKNKQDFLKEFKLSNSLQGLVIYLSNPKSPASVATRLLYSFGDINMQDPLLGVNITYDVLSFFQVNVPVFEQVLSKIKQSTKGFKNIDLYSGVGSIGAAIGNTDFYVESDLNNVKFARRNAKNSKSEVIHSISEQALSVIDSEHALIVDPPRAGLKKQLIQRILEVCPPKIVYLSCNPSTQARDIAVLKEKYAINFVKGYNFFPRTPHIESLVVLQLK